MCFASSFRLPVPACLHYTAGFFRRAVNHISPRYRENMNEKARTVSRSSMSALCIIRNDGGTLPPTSESGKHKPRQNRRKRQESRRYSNGRGGIQDNSPDNSLELHLVLRSAPSRNEERLHLKNSKICEILDTPKMPRTQHCF
jgi:hypothetical protein